MDLLLKQILFVPKHIIYSHYVLFVHLTHSAEKMDEIENKCQSFRKKLFD